MRRMKIRATPNFGGVVRNAQPSSSAPVSSSSASATSVSTAPVCTVAVNTTSTSITPVTIQTTSTTLVDIKPLSASSSTNAPITTTPINTKPPITASVNTKLPITAPVNTKLPITTPVNTKPPITTPVNTKPPITAPVNTKPPITAPVNTKPPITTPVNTKPPIITPVKTKPPSTTPIHTKPSSTSQVGIKPHRISLVNTSLTKSLDTTPSHTSPVSATIVSAKKTAHVKGTTEEPGDNSSAAHSPKRSSQVQHIPAPSHKPSVSPHVTFSETDKCLQRKDVVSSTEGCISQSSAVGKKVSFASTSSTSTASKFTSQSNIKSALLNTSSEPSIQILSSTVPPPPQQQDSSPVMQSLLVGSVSLSNESTEPLQVKSEGKSVVNARRRRMKFQPVVGGIKKEVVEKSTLESDSDLKAKLNISVVHTDGVPLQRKLSPCSDGTYKPPFDDSQGQKSKQNEATDPVKTIVIEKGISESSERNPAVVILKEYDTKNGTVSPQSLLKMGKSAVGETQGLESRKEQADSEVVEVVVTEESSNKDSKNLSGKCVENSSSATSCKRRSKIRAMPSFFTKRKTIKKEVAIQESDHTSQTRPSVGEGVQGTEECKLATGDSLRPHLPTNKPSSSLLINQDTADDDVVSIDLSQAPEIASNSITERKTGGVNITDMADAEDHKFVKRKKPETTKKKLSSSRAEEIEEDNIEIDVVNSDDSSGDKENSARVTISHRHVKKDIDIKEHRLQAPQKRKSKLSSEVSQKKTLTSHGRRVKTEIKTESKFTDDSCDEKTEKQIFRERKEEYRKKVSRGGLEPSKLTMFDLIFWNPANNPMPGRTDTPKKRVSLSSKCDTESMASEVQEEQRIDDLGLDHGDPAPCMSPPTPEEVQICESSSQPTADPELANKNPEEEKKKDKGKELEQEEENIFAPKVKIGPNGQIIVDEQSIKIQTTAAKNRDEILSKAEVVEENNDTSHYGRWSKKRTRSSEWTIKETARFYKALSTVGTDFSMMEALITWRSRAELKTKFKKEERINRELIDRALRDSTQFDVSLFEGGSDYDPEEDRKQTRQADREEAKQRRLEMKQAEKALEMKQKQLEKSKVLAHNKKRKKLLKKARKAQEMKRTLQCSEDEEPAEPRTKVKRARIKKRTKPERRNSFVIDEVTVTWECSRPPLEPSSEQAIEQTVEENCTAPIEDPLQDNIASPSHEPVDVGSMEDTDEILPSVDELNISNVPSAAQCEKYLLGRPPREDSETETGVIPDRYRPLHQILSEDFIIEGTAVEEDVPSTETPNVDENDASLPISSGEYITGDILTGDEHEAEVEVSQPEQWLDSPIMESVNEDGSQMMWHFPVSAIQTQDDGQQVIVVLTSNGRYSVPVPVLPPGTSNIVVMATPAPDCPGEHIYHVYVMSPVEEGEQ